MFIDYRYNYSKINEHIYIKYYELHHTNIKYAIHRIENIPKIVYVLKINNKNDIHKIIKFDRSIDAKNMVNKLNIVSRLDNLPNKLHALYIYGFNTIKKIENIPPVLHTLKIWGENEINKLENLPFELYLLIINGRNKIKKIENLNFRLYTLIIHGKNKIDKIENLNFNLYKLVIRGKNTIDKIENINPNLYKLELGKRYEIYFNSNLYTRKLIKNVKEKEYSNIYYFQ